MRVLVCGGRDYADWRALGDVLSAIHRERPIAAIIHGGRRGADMLAHRWAWAHAVERLVFHAEWERHGRSAGPIRNRRMLEEGRPDLVVAFSGGRGTADMVRRARAAGVPVREV